MSAATAGLNLLASLLGAPESGKTGRGDDEGKGGAKGRGGRDSFKINLFPDNPADEAQAKDGDEVRYAHFTREEGARALAGGVCGGRFILFSRKGCGLGG